MTVNLQPVRQADHSDQKLSSFILGLRPQKLRFLEIISSAGVGAQSCRALNSHSCSLKELKLSLTSEALPHLALLKDCTAVETLQLTDVNRVTDIETAHPEVFQEIVSWLKQCNHLHHLGFSGFKSAAAILGKVLQERKTELRKLEVDYYVAKDHAEFHQALAEQHSLHALFLKGDSEGMTQDDIALLVRSLTELKNLRELEMRGVSDWFSDKHIIAIATSLLDLEDLYVSGYGVTDAIWEAIGRLARLRSITLNAITSFTLHGLLGFVSSLGPSNQGLVVAVDMADPTNCLTEDEQALVRMAIEDTVGGRFEYVPHRGEPRQLMLRSSAFLTLNLYQIPIYRTRTMEGNLIER